MNVLALKGLDGANPLHMLAALGALLVTEDLAPGQARLGWTRTAGRYQPRLAAPMEADAWAREVAARVQKAGATPPSESPGDAQRRLAKLKTAEKELAKAAKEAAAKAKAEAKASGLRGADARALVERRAAAARARLDEAGHARRAAELEVGSALGFGPAHLGDLIEVPVKLFRAQAEHALACGDSVTLRQLSALASDACCKGEKVAPTPYSFSNGSSNQLLLKDFRNLATCCTEGKVAASLLRGERVVQPRTNLNWDPAALRSAAYQWADPATQEKATDVAVNALAYLGLGMVPCFPGPRGLTAVGFDRGFTWPLWGPLLSVDVVGALLAEAYQPADAASRRTRAARGVLVTFRSERVNPDGKRNYFAPSRAL